MVEKPLLKFLSVKENLFQGKKTLKLTDRVQLTNGVQHNVCVGSFRLLQTKRKTVREWRQYFFLFFFPNFRFQSTVLLSGYLSFPIWFRN